MFTKIMKWICIMALLLAAFWRFSAGWQIMLEILICVGALLVAGQAAHRSKYLWGAGFAAIAVLFNPISPLALSRRLFLWLDLVCIGAFLASLAVLKTRPLLSIPSITGKTPGSESL
jgi:hypothetical protein